MSKNDLDNRNGEEPRESMSLEELEKLLKEQAHDIQLVEQDRF